MDLDMDQINSLKKERRLLEVEMLLRDYHHDCDKQRKLEKYKVNYEFAKQRRRFLKSEGLCLICAKPKDTDMVRCSSCELKHKECQKRHNLAKQKKRKELKSQS